MKMKLFSTFVILAVLFGQFAGGGNVLRARADTVVCRVNAAAVPGGDGSSWETAYNDLQQALDNASCTEIDVAAGSYFPSAWNDSSGAYTFTLRNNLQILGGYPVDATADSTPDPHANETILDGNIGNPGEEWDNSMHIVTADGTDSTAVLDGFTITNGFAVGDGPTFGGGINISGGSPTLRNLVITGNMTNGGGGGIYLYDSNPTLTNININNNIFYQGSSPNGGGLLSMGSSPVLDHVTFTSNLSNNGGGMYIGADYDGNSGTPTLTNVTFENNQTTGAGGGFYVDSGNLSLADSHFDGNTAVDGGGIYVNGGEFAMQNTVLENGNVTDDGGGLYIGNPDSAIIRGSTIKNNHADYFGGGVAVIGSIVMVGVTVSGNKSVDGGGGIYLSGSPSADFVNLVIDNNQASGDGYPGGGVRSDDSTARFTNLLLTHNSANNNGGGMALFSSDITIVNATIAQNDAGSGSGTAIQSDNQLSITNSIVWAQAGQSIPVATTVTHSILQDGCPYGATCTDVSTSDPQFADPQLTSFHLSPKSPAVDAGDVSSLPADTYDLDGDGNTTEHISQDLDGKVRIAGSSVDMGVYEMPALNINWTEAQEMTLSPGNQPDVFSDEQYAYLDHQGQSMWYRFQIQPGSKLVITLTDLPAN
ncbi:MAG: right-handed parallel beta-helix repeat-containing protein, partial [Anaerolineales bacterium]